MITPLQGRPQVEQGQYRSVTHVDGKRKKKEWMVLVRRFWLTMLCMQMVCSTVAISVASAAQEEPWAPIATGEPTAIVENILLDEWQQDSLADSVTYTITHESPDMPEELRQEILAAKEDYREAWVQVRYPTEVAQQGFHRVVVTSYTSQVLLFREGPVNFGDNVADGWVQDSLSLAVRKELTAEEALAAFAACGPVVEIRDDAGQTLARLPLCFEQVDAAFARAVADGFHLRITHGHLREDETALLYLPDAVAQDARQHPDDYFIIDLLGAKWTEPCNPVLGLRFRVENRQDVWVVPMNDSLYSRDHIGPTGNWDNLLDGGPAFASVTLVYRKPEGVDYPYQAFEDLQGLEIGAYFSPVGYGSLGQITGTTLYGPKVKTLVDLSCWEAWRLE